jgi:two-component system, cell cycle response regulator
MSKLPQPGAGPSGGLPQRILLVDDDELELELMADRLRSLGFETQTAGDGAAALELLQAQSFPLVITDWQMPRMDGIQFTESLRERGDDETYIIMLTVLDDGTSHERGYFAGVDDYLSKRAPDVKIVAGVRAAFKAVSMRHALHAAKQQQSNVVDVASGVLADRMRSEVKRAARYNRHLSILVFQLEREDGAAAPDMLTRAAEIVVAGVRTDIDFVTRYRSVDGVQRIAALLPETERAAAIAVGGRLSNALAPGLQTPIDSFTVRVGCSSFIPGEEAQPSEQIAGNIESLLRTAEAGVRVAPSPVHSATA